MPTNHSNYPEQPSLAVIEVMDFIKMDLPHREVILPPWLPAQAWQ